MTENIGGEWTFGVVGRDYSRMDKAVPLIRPRVLQEEGSDELCV